MPPPEELILHRRGADEAVAAGWTYPDARAAADAHMRGHFAWSYQLAVDMPRFPPIRAALGQRRAGVCSAPWNVKAKRGGRIEAAYAEKLWRERLKALTPQVVDEVVMLGLSVVQYTTTVVETRTGELRHKVFQVEHWPISCVQRYTGGVSQAEGYYAIDDRGGKHLLPRAGTTDGRWIVFGRSELPHLYGAVTALDVPFIAGSLNLRALGNYVKNLGNAGIFATLAPDAVPRPTKTDGTPEDLDEASGLVEDLAALLEGRGVCAARDGTKATVLSLDPDVGKLFVDVPRLWIAMVSLAIMGHDRALTEGSVYNSPQEQSVPEDLSRATVQDVEAGWSALFTHVASMNGAPAPALAATVPDTDVAADQAHAADMEARFNEILRGRRENGLPITQEVVDDLRDALGLDRIDVAEAEQAAQIQPEIGQVVPSSGTEVANPT